MTKSELRKLVKNRISLLSDLEKETASQKCSLELIQKKEFLEADVVLSYMAMKNEIDPMHVSQTALMSGKTLALPRCIPNSNQMEFHCIRNDIPLESQIEKGMWGIMEPKIGLPSVELEKLSGKKVLLIVPGVAFSLNGDRLGHGAGYYDAYISRMKKICGINLFTLGICFSCQLVDDVPQEEHDIKIDSVIYA